MQQRLIFRGAVVVNLLALALWLACWLGHANPFLKVLIVSWPLVLASVVACILTARTRRSWWPLLAVVPAIWAYTPLLGLALAIATSGGGKA
ncbi:hypothetical protein [Novosphingobium terrae]|uniref:hypothetical protein n=1 Tax=Novosphingobium terrae TaxID=2726189 RepID=UPI00197ECE03|nr:hypothetical protein [Novosphingobium terrae]